MDVKQGKKMERKNGKKSLENQECKQDTNEQNHRNLG